MFMSELSTLANRTHHSNCESSISADDTFLPEKLASRKKGFHTYTYLKICATLLCDKPAPVPSHHCTPCLMAERGLW